MLTTLASFDISDGAYPSAALVLGGDGSFYGTTSYGGASSSCTGGCGTISKITPGGTLTTLHSFDSTDGAIPTDALAQAFDGDLYGTTTQGGSSDLCHTNITYGCGTIFKITPSGVLTTLENFDVTDGASPLAGLVLATDGNFYGTTSEGGSGGGTCTPGGGCGTVFKITPRGTLTILHNFTSAEGTPFGGLVQATNGNFYGTTVSGGAYGDGTVFSLNVGLSPFVETLPTSGKVGSAVRILGTNLTGTTSVTFNGAAATFTLVSSTEIDTTVPTSATTGKIKVTTPSGTLSSNVVFRVRP